MRGILVQSLVERGVPFDVALQVATRVRDEVADRGEVTPLELRERIEDSLPPGLDAERPRGERLGPPPARVVSPHGSSTPFSKGILAVSLQGAGLDPEDAYEVSRELETRLRLHGQGEILRADLRGMVAETIERRRGSRAARRYRVWRAALEDARPVFVLLGGSSGVGKTSIAVEVARRLEITRVIGTDSIRQIMRLMFSEDLMPEIHCSTFDAHRVLSAAVETEAGRVVAGYREQAQKIVVGVQALLDRAVEENTSTLVEGVNLLPGLLDLKRYEGRAHVIFQVIATLDSDAYRAHFTSRSRTARARVSDRYLTHLRDILEIQEYILLQADQLGLPIVDNVHLDEAVLSVIGSVIGSIEKSMAPLG